MLAGSVPGRIGLWQYSGVVVCVERCCGQCASSPGMAEELSLLPAISQAVRG